MPDDATAAAPADEPLPTTELDPAHTVADGPLAYSDHTTSIPVVDYQPPRLRPAWIVALVLLAAGAVAAAAFFLGRSTAPTPDTAGPASARTPDVALAPAPPEPPATVTVTQPVPLPTVTVPAPAPPPAIATSVPPLATPQARIAEPLICSLHHKHPQMQPVDLALTLLDRNIYDDYDEAMVVVELVLKDGCHGI